jgi:hypothetical protein
MGKERNLANFLAIVVRCDGMAMGWLRAARSIAQMPRERTSVLDPAQR